MERERLIKKINDLAERIRSSSASDAAGLVTDAAQLYEMAILLKHFPAASTPSAQGEKIEIKIEEKIEKKTNDALDLFSSAISSEPKKERQSEKKATESVAEKISHNKIADLKSVIGINEKFQFINELFDGNMKEYNIALDQINNFSSLDEAVNYLANLKEMYKWNNENPVASNFEELVQRRFF